jgi:hypothetical protein
MSMVGRDAVEPFGRKRFEGDGSTASRPTKTAAESRLNAPTQRRGYSDLAEPLLCERIRQKFYT